MATDGVVKPEIESFWADVEGIHTPLESGLFEWGIASYGTALLFADNIIIINNIIVQKRSPIRAAIRDCYNLKD